MPPVHALVVGVFCAEENVIKAHVYLAKCVVNLLVENIAMLRICVLVATKIIINFYKEEYKKTWLHL